MRTSASASLTGRSFEPKWWTSMRALAPTRSAAERSEKRAIPCWIR